MSGYAGGRGEALPWWLVLAEGVVVALLGLVLLVAPGASLVFLFWLLGVYLLLAGVLRLVGIFLDASSWGWKLAAGRYVYKQVDVEELLEQARRFRGFWPMLAQLPQSHPFAVRRIRGLYDLGFFEAPAKNPPSEGVVDIES